MENSQQQKVRHIPIFVEGRDEPIINKGHEGQSQQAPPPNVNAAPQQNSANSTSAFASAESSSGPHHQNPHNFGRPPMGFSGDMGFGQDIPMSTGSIFDRAKDFPVRDFFNMRAGSPRRSESPINVHHPTRNSPSPAAGQQQQQYQQQQQRQPTSHNNQDRSVPVQRSTTPQRQMPPNPQPQQAPPQPEQAVPAKQKAIEDSITKIQKIQASVLGLMSRVEEYDGTNRKEYSFLDEMLTQNLLKLDDIDAEGKENIKNARREAIKCINSLIQLLEAKNDEVAARGGGSESSESKNQTEASSQPEPPTQNGVNGSSKNSSYDNVNNVKQTSSNNSVNMAEHITPEASLEAKVNEAMKQQDGK